MPAAIAPFSTAAMMSAALTEGRITAEALAHETLERIARLDPKLMAFIRLTEQRALSEARASDVRRARAQIRGPLDGIPYAVKDIFDVASEPTLAGSKLLGDHLAEEDCTAVRRLFGIAWASLRRVGAKERPTALRARMSEFRRSNDIRARRSVFKR